ncbi:atp-dependent protease [Diplodia corticola]|uniref:Atp-dependent protease n=1 Tax=Diplodia corticola TaxID=236234 RepID=A0A1J9QXG7_9PEZI|nr:atp-dependent protease [Diplodia corticola]OJD33073.1 atp-dependent protease [Diplodia corticola]
MSLLRQAGPSFTGSEEKSLDPSPAPPLFMRSRPSLAADGKSAVALAAHDDARHIVRLVQCPQCSRPFCTPVTLPCGHSLCRRCLPDSFHRQHISYPATPDRRRGITCPIPDCAREHAVGECNVDVTLLKIMDLVAQLMVRSKPATDDSPIVLEVVRDHAPDTPMEKDAPLQHEATVLHGGRLLATYTLADMGQLDVASEVSYTTLDGDDRDFHELDTAVLDRLKEATDKELDCHVCYNILLDPVTTSCGHTFCRKCLVRALDHTVHCPVCRRSLSIPPSLQGQASNNCLVALLNALCPDLVTARAEAVAEEERGMSELDTSLFVCTLGFPAMPTFLHIFEPRYRLMIRRALEGNGTFGMLMYNRSGSNQGSLGPVQFKEYGTMLQIINVQMMPDGRSLIETRGIGRFRVRDHGLHDGYIMGRVERIGDVSLAEEERLEAEDVRAAQSTRDAQLAAGSPHANHAPEPTIDSLSTREMLLIGVDFIERMRANSAPWLHQRILDAYGGPPDDPALFPYWFASILPIAEEEKYLLLPTTSVRERLKIVVSWIRRIESQRW